MIQSEIKYVRSLNNQKYRKEHNTYLIEGNKIVKEWLIFQEPIQMLIAESEWLKSHEVLLQHLPKDSIRVASSIELSKISNLQSSTPVMAVVHQRSKQSHNFKKEGWTLVLDRLQDPGNMGTIIRIADWFGIEEILYSPGTVEVYNPKVIQSTMGSFLRVNLSEIAIERLIENARKPLFAAVLNGTSIYDPSLQEIKGGYLIIGNESQGVHPDLIVQIPHHITIPKIGKAESLNAGVACGIICSHLCKTSQ